uniref:Uncharacterized protein n=1 Tax=Arundo donax TaxID=35708 RepID=A0A0A9AQ72_ARUDO
MVAPPRNCFGFVYFKFINSDKNIQVCRYPYHRMYYLDIISSILT